MPPRGDSRPWAEQRVEAPALLPSHSHMQLGFEPNAAPLAEDLCEDGRKDGHVCKLTESVLNLHRCTSTCLLPAFSTLRDFVGLLAEAKI